MPETCQEMKFNFRTITKRFKVSWGKLSNNERLAWNELGWNSSNWYGNGKSPNVTRWKELSLQQQSVVKYGLKMSAIEWDEYLTKSVVKVNSQASLKSAKKSVLTDDYVQNGQQNSVITKIKNVLHEVTKPPKNDALWVLWKFASNALQTTTSISLSTLNDSLSDPINVNNLETVLYLDDSGSMKGMNLYLGQKVLESLSSIVQNSVRVVKFGSNKTVLSSRNENSSLSIATAGWDASSGGTYMWKMIEEDISNRYRPGNEKLRIVIITDGQDTDSPNEYNGMKGMDPMMKTLLKLGFDIEWHIVCIGSHSNKSSIGRYKALTAATGGSFLLVSESAGFDRNSKEVVEFVNSVKKSGGKDAKHVREEKIRKYQLEAKTGKTIKFDWLKEIPPNKN